MKNFDLLRLLKRDRKKQQPNADLIKRLWSMRLQRNHEYKAEELKSIICDYIKKQLPDFIIDKHVIGDRARKIFEHDETLFKKVGYAFYEYVGPMDEANAHQLLQEADNDVPSDGLEAEQTYGNREYTEIKPEESWLHIAAVVHNQELSGLSTLIFSSYQIEEMMARHEPCKQLISPRYTSLYIAWVCVLFNALRVIYEAHQKIPCIPKDKIGELKNIKKCLGKARGYLAKLSESRKEDKTSENQKEIIFISNGCLIRTIIDNSKHQILDEKEFKLDRRDISRRITSIFKDCCAPESGIEWRERLSTYL